MALLLLIYGILMAVGLVPLTVVSVGLGLVAAALS